MTAARLLIIGPQGSGKGTQGVRIADALGIPAVSTGDVFRANVKEGTELGLKVKAIIDAGDLVPDTLTGEIVRDRLAQADAANGFLLDGYPRNLGQVGDLDGFLDERGEPLTAVIELVVPRDESIQRLSLRATEQGRADDNAESIAKRLAIYESETAPILDLYRERGIVDQIDGVGSLDEVYARIQAALEARGIAAS
ncbi:adenylate kinase [Microbacterium laevaniformans]|uniref:adenylate kinase n=1 Tax=Microbacterium TaxID=33882 RepID=UPI0002586191|nr:MULTISPECIES: adenylate kinase [Microbacterium]EIC07943.1 Adenylate kinase [Microbacterium laevaniformans OR221]EPD86450.1 adenylate kinase [Microbacterium sp. oral taxon 186 str. F0373]MBM7751548.1 adenylate kinase [Microbacterium laevaniformans]GLJ63709.1 adenylate kinase [Microbacterium laevaniformans]